MVANSKIEWTDHTFNPWWGCVKVSPACKHCYAETWSRRVGLQVWGARAERRFFSEKHWTEPLRWEKESRTDGLRRRVFCASMADVLEARSELNVWRERLWDLIDKTPHLDWLLLTKRPQNFRRYLPTPLPKNVWIGTTVENQRWAAERLHFLVEHQAVVRFLSCEPLLGPLDLSEWLGSGRIDWVIAGGESGSKARPTHPHWIQSIRDQCAQFNIPFHFKQWGHWAPHAPPKGRRVKEFEIPDGSNIRLWRYSKKDAGRILDGRTWDDIPKLVSK